MIKEVDEDNDGWISFREFVLIFKKAHDGKLQNEDRKTTAQSCHVSTGVKGAKPFFQGDANGISCASHLSRKEGKSGRTSTKEESIQGESIHVAFVLAVTLFL